MEQAQQFPLQFSTVTALALIHFNLLILARYFKLPRMVFMNISVLTTTCLSGKHAQHQMIQLKAHHLKHLQLVLKVKQWAR